MLYGCTMQTEEVIEEVVKEPIVEEVAKPEPRDCEDDGFEMEEMNFGDMNAMGVHTGVDLIIDYCMFGDGSACAVSTYEDSFCNHMQPLCKEEGWYWPEHYEFFPTELIEEELIMEADCEGQTVECKDDGWYVGEELLVEYGCVEKPTV